VVRSFRVAPPAHYRLRVETFSLLSSLNIKKFNSGLFQAGGNKWKLCLYPSGHTKGKGEKNVSLYLEIEETGDLSPDESGILWRFYGKKKEWGFDLLSLEKFRDTSNGYLKDDSCEFGVEVYVVEHTGKGESLSIIKNPRNNTFTWEIFNFSTVYEEGLWSKEFTICGHKWYVLFYICSSEFHSRADWKSLPPGQEVFIKYKLRIVNQFGNADHEHIVWFTPHGDGDGPDEHADGGHMCY
ncbi:hypothetical protein RJ639_029109, partial [Escallonia herrerae]